MREVVKCGVAQEVWWDDGIGREVWPGDSVILCESSTPQPCGPIDFTLRVLPRLDVPRTVQLALDSRGILGGSEERLIGKGYPPPWCPRQARE